MNEFTSGSKLRTYNEIKSLEDRNSIKMVTLTWAFKTTNCFKNTTEIYNSKLSCLTTKIYFEICKNFGKLKLPIP